MTIPFKSWLIVLGVFPAMAAGCGAPAAFTFDSSAATGGAGSGCTAGTTTRNLRIYTMVDNSGSTRTTDPNQHYRVQTMRDFLATYGTRANLSYGFGYFADTAALYDMTQSRFIANTVAAPFGSAAGITGALDTYHASIPPNGSTGYGAAFAALESAISRDEAAGAVDDYAVVFMSDGQPTDLAGDIPTELARLANRLKQTAAANGTSDLTLSTVYFGSAGDATSIRNLRILSTEGGGQFVDTNQLGSGGLSIDDVVTIPGC